jgi:hypothetical protein
MERITDLWQARLPDTLLDHVVWPVRVEDHHDGSVPVSKWRGYDVLGTLCYYRHRYSQWSEPLDELEEGCSRMLREEELEAWRTLLGTWVRRLLRVECDSDRGELVLDSGFEQVQARAIPRL